MTDHAMLLQYHIHNLATALPPSLVASSSIQLAADVRPKLFECEEHPARSSSEKKKKSEKPELQAVVQNKKKKKNREIRKSLEKRWKKLPSHQTL